MSDPLRPHFDKLIARCKPLDTLKMVVVCPHRPVSLAGAMAAMRENLIEPIFVGDLKKIVAAADAAGEDISAIEIIPATSDGEAANIAVALIHQGHGNALMKGHIHTDTMLAAVVKRDGGLRTKRWLSHCFLMDIPDWPKPVLITDAALNIAPDVKKKLAIAQNAVDLMQKLGIAEPKVAVLSAVENPGPAMPSSMDAHEMAELASQGAVTGGLVAGPFALDIAVSPMAAELKGVVSPVAGNADILLVPTIESGNILFKALTFMAGSEAAGLVVGAQVPIVLTSRANSERARVASCAMALLANHFG